MDQTGMDASLHLQGGLKCQLCDDTVSPPPVASPPVWMHFNIGAGVRCSPVVCELKEHVLLSSLYMMRNCTERVIYSSW